MKSFALLALFLFAVQPVARAQSFLAPARPIIRQAMELSQLTVGVDAGTDFDDYTSVTGTATFAPPGRFGFYLEGGPLLGDVGGSRFSGGLAVTVLPRSANPRIPIVQIHGGVGYSSFHDEGEDDSREYFYPPQKLDLKQLDIPVAVGGFWTFPLPTGTKFQPWLAPRLHLRSTDPSVGESKTHLGYGGSFGLQVRFGKALGLYAGGDVLSIQDLSDDRDAGVEFIGGVFYHVILNATQ